MQAQHDEAFSDCQAEGTVFRPSGFSFPLACFFFFVSLFLPLSPPHMMEWF